MPFVNKFKMFVFLIMVSMSQTVTKASNVSLLIALPLHPTSGPRVNWERGLEILPGAHLAVNDVNNDSTILPGHTLKLIVIDSGRDQFEFVQQLVNLMFHQQVNIVGVGGILDPKAVSILLPLVANKGVLMNAITYTDRLGSLNCNREFLPLPSPSAMASVLFNFIKTMNWKYIGLITDTKDAYFFSVAQTLLQMAEMNDSLTLSPYYYIESSHTVYAVKNIVKSKAKIIVVSLSAEATIRLLCAVREKGLLWPHYAWIFHSLQVKDLLEQKTVCDVKDVINGIFFVDVQPWSGAELMSGIYNATLRTNGYAKLVYDSVWAMAIALNESCLHQVKLNDTKSCLHHTDSDATAVKILEFHQDRNVSWNFKVFHIRNLKQVLISTMQFSNSSITASSFSLHMLESAPKGELPVVTQHPPLAYAVLIGLQIALMTIFVTLTLVLYIYFRKEPEVKATSFTLSLLMFAGCYFNLVYLCLLLYANHMLHSVDVSRDNVMCLGIQWFSGPGISLPIMLATLLVKMLRIYHIFHNTKLHLGCYCSDLALAFYVLLILLPDILVNLIWAVVDPYQVFFEHQVRGSYIYLEKTCKSTYQTPRIGVLCAYLLILTIALASVAIITRKVRLQHFKDTKKVNILSFILGLGIIITFSCWLLVQTLDTTRYIATLTVHIPHSVMIISFQSLLFVPKVFPPLWQRFKKTFSS